ncbi:unnamed protein product [Pieris macdunnoughi]|uniref:Reverse transcriptase domain-containing protein n=1 Tax=Pieris macdunnoughi TaxID=345717 RepID=A0A821Y280_9NEOP|nr:unnamed protein product [Pieris macdunnoughi]
MDLRFIQSNLNHCASAQDLLIQSLTQWIVNIGIVSEPYMVPDKNNWVGDRDGLVAVFINDVNLLSVASTMQGRGCVALKIGRIAVIGVYFSPNKTLAEFETFLSELGCLVSWCRPLDLIVAGDFNAKSTVWGSPVSDERGDALLDWLATQNLVSLNRGNVQTCVRMNGGSIVDVTFSSPALASRVYGWRVLSEVETLSDHKYIRFDILDSTVSLPGPALSEIGPRWSRKNLDKDALTEVSLVEAWNPKPSNFTIDSEVEWFRDSLTRISNVAMPRIGPISPKQSVYWWSSELARLRGECVKARRRYTRFRRRHLSYRDPDEEASLYTSYQEAKRALRLEIAEAKDRAWKELLNSLDRDPWGRPYNIVMSKLRPWRPPLTSTMEPTFLRMVVTSLFPCDSTPFINVDFDHSEDIPEVSEGELGAGVFKIQNKKTAPGPDGLHGTVWAQSLKNGLFNRFRDLLSDLLRKDIFPNSWKVGQLLLLRKFGKPVDSPSAYRPIVLLPEVGKLFERIIVSRLEKHLQIIGPNLFDTQFGFRRGRSTIDALAKLRDLCEETVSGGGVVLAVSLDIANAFNTIPWRAIMDGLLYHGVPVYLRHVVGTYLSDRSIIYPSREGWRSYQVRCGVPQGSVLGPLLWNIGFDAVLRGRLMSGVGLICYADDTLVTAKGCNYQEASLLVTAGVEEVVTRIRQLGLRVALQKSDVICFARRSPPRGAEIIVDGVHMALKSTLKYLGLAGAYRTVSCDAACVIAATPPWHLEALALGKIFWRRAEARSGGFDPPLEVVKVWKEEYRRLILLEWRDELSECRFGLQTVDLIRPFLKHWVDRRWGSLSYRLVQVLSGHGCFGSYLHRIVGREATPACHHCDCREDTVRHTVEECPAWDGFRSVLADSIVGNLSLPLIIQRMVEADNDGPWNAFKAFCEAVMTEKENAERQRENNSDAPPVRKRRPGQRRRAFARLP